MIRSIVFTKLFLLSLFIGAQEKVTINQVDGSYVSYQRKHVSAIKVEEHDSSVVFNLGNRVAEKFSIRTINTIHFQDSDSICSDPLAYNFVPGGLSRSKCSYVNLQTNGVITDVIDTVAGNIKELCESIDLEQSIDQAKIISYLQFGNSQFLVNWQLSQKGKIITLKVYYDLGNKTLGGNTMFVLHLKCGNADKNQRILNSINFQSFADVIALQVTSEAKINTPNHTTSSTVKAFPNPVSDGLTLRYDLNDHYSGALLYVADAQGRVVFSASKPLSGTGECLINTVAWTSGVYYLMLNAGQQTLTQKIIKQ